MRSQMFKESQMAVARVVHEHIDRSESRHGGVNGGLCLRRVRDVQRNAKQLIVVRAQTLDDIFPLARRGDHPVTRLKGSLSDSRAKAAACARDKPCFLHHWLLC